MPKKRIKTITSNFFSEVYDLVRLIPKGRVTSYGAIAAYLGTKSGARMVGWAMNASHKIKALPAHRVVNSHGMLTGKYHFQTLTTMQNRLAKEGIKVKSDKIENFKTIFWDPIKELP